MKDVHFGLLGLLLMSSLFLNAYLLFTRVTSSSEYRVASIIDGDTFVLSTGDRVRLLGTDAPEDGLCLADEAKQTLTNLLSDTTIQITESRLDHYGRQMGLVYADDVLVNTEMIRLGYAVPDYTSNSHTDLFKESYAEAKASQRGIHSPTCKKGPDTAPPNADCTIKGNIDKATGTRYYHFPTCRHYAQIVLDLHTDEAYFCTEQEAQAAGFQAAPDCLR